VDESALDDVTSWAWLVAAIACEIVATLALRSSRGFTQLVPVVTLAAGYAAAYYSFSRALRGLPLSTAYAVWSAAGTAVLAFVGMVAFGESRSSVKLASLALAVVAIAGLRLG
jgi:small multidrug resistance pump